MGIMTTILLITITISVIVIKIFLLHSDRPRKDDTDYRRLGMETTVTGLIFILIFCFIPFLVGVCILRWAFRVNAIVARLDTISKQLSRLTVQDNAHTGNSNAQDAPHPAGV